MGNPLTPNVVIKVITAVQKRRFTTQIRNVLAPPVGFEPTT